MKKVILLDLVLLVLIFNIVYGLDDLGSIKYRMELNKGWNLISIPLILENNKFPAALSSIEGKYSAIFANIDGEWKSFNPEKPEFLNSLTEINPEYDYFIRMEEDGVLETKGVELSLVHISHTSLMPPPLPAEFWGLVTIDGNPAPDGLLAEGFIDGVNYAQPSYTIYGYYDVIVVGDFLDTPEKEGGVNGDIINFTIGGLYAEETGIWSGGSSERLDLTCETPEPIPEFTTAGIGLLLVGVLLYSLRKRK